LRGMSEHAPPHAPIMLAGLIAGIVCPADGTLIGVGPTLLNVHRHI